MADIKVQHHKVTVGANGQTYVLSANGGSAVNSIDKAFFFPVANFNTGRPTVSAGEVDDLSAYGDLTDTDTVTFTRPLTQPGVDIEISFLIVEYVGAPGGAHEFTVLDRIEFIYGLTITSATATLAATPTNPGDVVPVAQGATSSDTSNSSNDLLTICWLSGANTANFETGEGNTNAAARMAKYAFVEFTGSAWTVARCRINGATSGVATDMVDGLDGLSGSVVDVGSWANAFALSWGQATTEDRCDDNAPAWIEPTGGASTQVEWFFRDATPVASDLMVHVVSNPDLVATRFSRGWGSGPATSSNDVTGAGLTALDASLITYTCATRANLNYQRGFRAAELTSLTNVTSYAGTSGSSGEEHITVVDLAALVDISAPTDPFPHVTADFGTSTVTPSAVKADFGAGLVDVSVVAVDHRNASTSSRKLLMSQGSTSN